MHAHDTQRLAHACLPARPSIVCSGEELPNGVTEASPMKVGTGRLSLGIGT